MAGLGPGMVAGRAYEWNWFFIEVGTFSAGFVGCQRLFWVPRFAEKIANPFSSIVVLMRPVPVVCPRCCNVKGFGKIYACLSGTRVRAVWRVGSRMEQCKRKLGQVVAR